MTLYNKAGDKYLKLNDVVVLKKDLPEYNLKHGAIGTVVEVYQTGDIEVEFTQGATTVAVITLSPEDVEVIG